ALSSIRCSRAEPLRGVCRVGCLLSKRGLLRALPQPFLLTSHQCGTDPARCVGGLGAAGLSPHLLLLPQGLLPRLLLASPLLRRAGTGRSAISRRNGIPMGAQQPPPVRLLCHG